MCWVPILLEPTGEEAVDNSKGGPLNKKISLPPDLEKKNNNKHQQMFKAKNKNAISFFIYSIVLGPFGHIPTPPSSLAWSF